jgi:Phosphoesterase family
VANSDQVAVINTKSLSVERTLSVERPEGQGSSPVALTVSREGPYLVVADAGADELAVFKLPGLTLAGRIPTADYPTDVQAVPGGKVACEAGGAPPSKPRAKRHRRKHRKHRKHHHKRAHAARKKHRKHRKKKKQAAPAARTCPKLLWTAAKGMGTGPNPNGPDPYKISDANANSFQYLPTIVFGRAGILDVPNAGQLANYTHQSDAQVRPSNPEPAPKDTPLKPNGPIKHVFYIVRENRTYDQVLGDVSKGDGDPNLTIFGKQVTPNMHALVDRFGLPDHVYANSEASIDGHFWTSAAKVSDYVNKNWHANYGGRGRPYDFGVYAVTWPQNGFLFDQAEREGIPYFNYGEAVAGVVPLTDKDRTPQETSQVAAKLAKSDLGPPQGCYPNDASINTDAITGAPVWDSTPPPAAGPAESRFDCFRNRFNSQLAAGNVPAFNYLVLSNDHTVGSSPGERTPRALVADNDYALGQIVDLISHSSIWNESAIFVIEDDSQDGADHVDAHRIPAAVISPFAKRGAVVHTRYDFLSVIRSMELILGMRPLGLFDALATPMYDSFTATPDNAEPFNAVAPTWDLLEKNTASSPNAALSRGLNFRSFDRVPQRTLDRILWQSVHGAHSAPPPPGPNAERETGAEPQR